MAHSLSQWKHIEAFFLHMCWGKERGAIEEERESSVGHQPHLSSISGLIFHISATGPNEIKSHVPSLDLALVK